MQNKLTPGIYRHYKGGCYEALGIAIHSETLEELVLYRSRDGSPDFPVGTLWVRPKAMFLGDVTENGQQLPRFTRIDG